MKDLILSGPGKNALSTSMMLRARAEVEQSRGQPLFLRGEGDAFSAGLNLKEVAGLDLDGMTTFLGALEDLVRALYEHDAPVVAWVNGHAIAGGCVLAQCADVRVMTGRESARIGLNEVALGLHFPPITLAMLRARLTPPSLERALLEAALYPAAEARALGLVDVIGEEESARTIASMMASYPHDVFAATKLLLRPRLRIGEAERAAFRNETIPYWASPERRAALLAVLERRKA
jgi:enoyl-CoA hydratase/carnithine racemase